MKVMVVEQGITVRGMLEDMIAQWGYDIVVGVKNSTNALDIIQNETSPWIVLLDWTLPESEDRDFCIKVKQMGNPVHIILLVAKRDDEIIELGIEAGADDFIVKPLYEKELWNRIIVGKRILEYQQILVRITADLEATTQDWRRVMTLDTLTGLASRRHFEEMVVDEWRRALRENNPISLIFIDIDYFIEYNEVYGHRAGKECLKKTAKVIKSIVSRAGDVAARYVGEKFVVLLPNTDNLGALVIAEAIRVGIKQLAIEHKASPAYGYITASIGTSTVATTAETNPAILLDFADEALEQAKAVGRNTVKQHLM